MDNQNKILREVAKALNLPIKKVEQVVMSPFALAHKTIVKKEKRSIHIRQVGTFLAPEVRNEIFALRKERIIAKRQSIKESQEEDPLLFT